MLVMLFSCLSPEMGMLVSFPDPGMRVLFTTMQSIPHSPYSKRWSAENMTSSPP